MSNDTWFYSRDWIRPGPADMRVSRHAVERYLQRVCGQAEGEGDVRYAVLEMWRTSYTATAADLQQARFKRRSGDVCRITKVDGRQFLMVARQDTIVTILGVW